MDLKEHLKCFADKCRSAWLRLRDIPVEMDLRPYQEILSNMNACAFAHCSDAALQHAARDLRQRAQRGVSPDALLVESFSLVREAAKRVLGLHPFDPQVICGIAMHQGKIAELPTGEGKTLAAVFPAFLNALTGQGVHVLTFNDYLAQRDARWMGPVYAFLGLTVGCVQESMPVPERQRAYAADVTYLTAKEAGFDYLRDHLCYEVKDLVQRPFHYAIVDEADSILIDEARVPLVIAGVMDQSEEDLSRLARVVKGLDAGQDYHTDEEKRNVFLTDAGLEKAESALGCGDLFIPENSRLLTKLHAALHAEVLLKRDVDYIVKDSRIRIVDAFTGRIMEKRHWPDGLQAAVEAKEKIRRKSRGTILGSIAIQHFLKRYPKVSGMTATAGSSADELHTFYGLKVVVVPPHAPCIRKDHPDLIFTTRKARTEALVNEISLARKTQRPVLVGTVSVEQSENLASSLRRKGIPCRVLNARNDALEAGIIARAGEPRAVTISTNMAGRGTDIRLGGKDEEQKQMVKDLGGLYVIGTNRHESLRIDRQLRGRAGRQGDPGDSRFFISLEDDLIENYGLRRLIPARYCQPHHDGLLDSAVVNQRIAHGQRVVEGRNLEIRKTLWKYSELIEMQRQIVYAWREEVLFQKSPLRLMSEQSPGRFEQIRSVIGNDSVGDLERRIMLFQIDQCWSEHLEAINHIREGIHLESLGGRSPVEEFRKLATEAFREFRSRVEERAVRIFETVQANEEGVDMDLEKIKGPSSTWTYMVTDSQYGHWVEMLKGRNIGYAAGAALYAAPFLFLMGIIQHMKRWKKGSAENTV